MGVGVRGMSLLLLDRCDIVILLLVRYREHEYCVQNYPVYYYEVEPEGPEEAMVGARVETAGEVVEAWEVVEVMVEAWAASKQTK